MRSDAELLAASGHDARAFRELYERYAQAIHGFFHRRTGDHEAALDLTAETFAQAWESRGRFADQHEGSVGPWLFGIARNLLLKAIRDRRMAVEASTRLQVRADRSAVEPEQSWLDGMDADLEVALTALPATQRAAVKLRVLQDQTYERIGAMLDCSPRAARIRVSRGLASLRTLLRPTRSH
ncbi:RNA polymerase ECF-subfamily sigma factor [Micromonospora sp. ATCC 39149]|uniref:Sigma-70 family RNA polymerase sigma factor n=1 Tax=Micromonospora carbonacea TaxID=47853 RepID=A0A7D6C718_9ACTN|nr:sigma-70 family RNA polymerase sigma factor [Micromonospora sp. ATCC 39149]EEP72176.1 RNA polymerase ECF-subfamily sigma factor [Micromonospora sp. ATCC 39149]QLJ98367.1 sigma-70 family RNA polymerase sigma factor [Micromonospora carbonacea]